MLVSTTRMLSRTSSTVCWSEMTPVSSRGAAPKTTTSSGWWTAAPTSAAASTSYQSTKPRMPACTMSPTHERSSALRSSNHGRSVAIRAVAAVLSWPDELRSASAARRREAGMGRL